MKNTAQKCDERIQISNLLSQNNNSVNLNQTLCAPNPNHNVDRNTSWWWWWNNRKMHWLSVGVHNGNASTINNAHAEKICGFGSEKRFVMPLSENNRFWFNTSIIASWWWYDTLSVNLLVPLLEVIANGWMDAGRQQHNGAKVVMFHYLWILFFTEFFFAPFHCLDATAEEHQCEILLDIITHYYLLEFDFLVVFFSVSLWQFAFTNILVRHT